MVLPLRASDSFAVAAGILASRAGSGDLAAIPRVLPSDTARRTASRRLHGATGGGRAGP